MKNFLQPGDSLTIPAPKEIHSGDVVILGHLKGIATHSAKPSEKLTIATTGVYQLPKAIGEAFTLGDLAYCKDGLITAKSEEATLLGIIVAASSQNQSDCEVKLL